MSNNKRKTTDEVLAFFKDLDEYPTRNPVELDPNDTDKESYSTIVSEYTEYKAYSYNGIEDSDESTSYSEVGYGTTSYYTDDVIEQKKESSDSSSVENEQVTSRQWNEEMQTAMNMNEDSLDDKLEKFLKIRQLSDSFVSEVIRIGKVIISEVHLPSSDKTYKPKSLGGIAGGEKYLIDNIFFKFCFDWVGMYGGTEWSMKSGSMELLGMIEYLKCKQSVAPTIHVPLIAIIDYKLLATTVLPIGDGSLVYGSGDAGRTIQISNDDVNKIMEKCAQKINIKKHKVTREVVEIFAPADIEVHVGTDSRYYVIDTARVIPPEFPAPVYSAMKLDPGVDPSRIDVEKKQIGSIVGFHCEAVDISEGSLFYENEGEINEFATALAGREIRGKCLLIYGMKSRMLYNQLRPEFLKKYKKPLSSDAFSGFGSYDPQSKEHNNEIAEATIYLQQEVITKFSEYLLQSGNYIFAGKQLTDEMHKYGINIRYLGMLRRLTQSNKKLQILLLNEIIARCVKNFIRRKLRSVQDASGQRQQKILIKYFNLLFGKSAQADFYWKYIIKIQIEAKFGCYGPCLTINEYKQNSLRDSIQRTSLLQLLEDKIGVHFFPHVHQKFQQNPDLFNTPEPLSVEDIALIGVRTKTLPLGQSDEIIKLLEIKSEQISKQPKGSVEQVKCLLTLIEKYFGRSSLEYSVHATKYAFSIRKTDVAESKKLAESVRNAFDMNNEYPIETFAMVLYILSHAYISENELSMAEKLLKRALVCLSRISGYSVTTNYSKHFLGSYYTHHPLLLLVLNELIKLQKDNLYYDLTPLSFEFYWLWHSFPFPGNEEARKHIFGNTIWPFVIVEENNFPEVQRLKGLFKPFRFDIVYGDKPLNHIDCQRWIETIASSNNISGVKLFFKIADPDWFNYTLDAMHSITCPLVHTQGTPLVIHYDSFSQLKVDGKVNKIEVLDMMKEDRHFAPTTIFHIYNYFYQPAAVIEINNSSGEISIPNNLLDKTTMLRINAVPFSGKRIAKQCLITPNPENVFLYRLRFEGDVEAVYECAIDPESSLAVSSLRDFYSVQEGCILVTDQGVVETTGVGSFVGRPREKNSSHRNVVEPLLGKDIVKIGVGIRKYPLKQSEINQQIHHVIALSRTGQVYSWGANKKHQLGHGDTQESFVPRYIQSLHNVNIVQVACGLEWTCLLSSDGVVYEFGAVPWSENQTCILYPTKVELSPHEQIVNIACNTQLACYVSAGGYAYLSGMLESQKYVQNFKFRLPNERIIQAAGESTCMLLLTESGRVYSLGQGELLGYSATKEIYPPFKDGIKYIEGFQLPGEEDIKIIAIYSSRIYALAIDYKYRVWFWGNKKIVPRLLTPLKDIEIKSAYIGGTYIYLSTKPHETPLRLPLEAKDIPTEQIEKQEKITLKEWLLELFDEETSQQYSVQFNNNEMFDRDSLTKELLNESKIPIGHQLRILHKLNMEKAFGRSWSQFFDLIKIDPDKKENYIQLFKQNLITFSQIKLLTNNLLEKLGVDINDRILILRPVLSYFSQELGSKLS